MKIKMRDIKILIYLMIYKLLLDFSYVVFVHKYFEYMGFTLDFSFGRYVFSFIVFLLIYTIIPKGVNKPSFMFLQLHFIIIFIPMFTIYSFMNVANTFFILCMVMFMLQCALIRILPSLKIKRITHSKKILYAMLFIMTAFVYISMLRSNGLPSLKTLNILSVYDVRASVSYPFLMGYLAIWQAKIVNPFLITIFYLKRKWKLLGVAVLLQLILYMITAHKTFLFIPVAIIFIMLIVKKTDFFKMLSLASAGGIFGALLLNIAAHNILIPSLFIRRLLMLPAQLRFFYYDFFKDNEFLYFSSGLIGKIFGIEYPYEMGITNLMGYIYYGNANTSANTGYIAEAYANLGALGMLIFSFILVIVFKLIDSLSTSLGKELVVGVTLFSVLSLNDSALLTSLLTGGLLFLMLVLYLYSE